MTRTVSSLTSVKKRRKRTVEATPSKNKEIEKRKETLVNSHATLTADLTEQMRVEETLMQTPACQLSSILILVWSRLNGKQGPY